MVGASCLVDGPAAAHQLRTRRLLRPHDVARAGLGLEALLDVHHTSRMAASAYALSVSVSAALTAAFASSAVDIIASKLDGT